MALYMSGGRFFFNVVLPKQVGRAADLIAVPNNPVMVEMVGHL